MTRIAIAAAAIVLAAMPGRAQADCPAGSLQLDDIVAAIQKTPTCRAAFEMMDACRFNSGGDVSLANAVIEKCETSFLHRLNARQKHSYQMEREACGRKVKNKSGTMYASFQATCEAKVAVQFARRWEGGK